MEPSARLYQCSFCHSQATICSKCDHGQIYCSEQCSALARRKSLNAAGKRYQATTKGKRNHAARQARYEINLKINLTHHGSLLTPPCASIQSLENNAKKSKSHHKESTLVCCFCNKPVFSWLRHHFLKRRNNKKIFRLSACPQAP